MEKNEDLKMGLVERFKVVSEELAFQLAEYLTDKENSGALKSMSEDGFGMAIRVKISIMEVEHVDLVIPLTIGKRFFVGLDIK